MGPSLFKYLHLLLYFTVNVEQSFCKLRNSTELTQMLRNVMKDYDKRILPTRYGEPAVVKLQMYIGDMVPVETIHMHYSMDLYLRAFWYDYRLDLPLEEGEQFPLNGMFVNEIWTPDIYFPLGKKGKLHDITRPNSLIRLFKSGLVRSSQRVSVTSFCPMDLANFPFDVQLCKFYLEPYAYNNHQSKLEWSYDGGGPIFYPADLRMYEFTLHKIKYTNVTTDYGIFGLYDSLVVEFHLRRNINYYLLQNYCPTALIVILSWVGFWIDYRSTPARVALGITTVLTITTLANSIRSTLPPVSYSKSIDYYLLACFLFVFAALVEFAVVGITDIKWKNLTRAEKKEIKRQMAMENGGTDSNSEQTTKRVKRKISNRASGASDVTRISSASTVNSLRSAGEKVMKVNSKVNDAFSLECSDTAIRVRESSARLQNRWIDKEPGSEVLSEEEVNEKETVNQDEQPKRFPFSIAAVVKAKQLARRLAEKHQKEGDIHMIDKLCRILFPITFIVFNILYFSTVTTKES